MRRYLVILAGLLTLLSPAAQAANSTVSAMTAASTIGGTELLYCVQGAADRKCTPAQLSTYMQSLISGDCTITSNVITCSKTGGVAFAASATTDTTNASNIGSGTLNTLRLPSPFTSGTKSGSTSVFGTTSGTLTSGHCVSFDASGNLVDAGAACGSGGGGSGTVTSVAAGCGISTGGSAITTTGTVSANVSARNNTSTSDTIASTDCGSLVTESNASAVTVGIPVATTSGFGTGFYSTVKNKGAGLVTISPTTSTIDGAASLTLSQQQSVDIVSDGSNYYTLPGRPYLPCAGLTGGTTCGTPIGTVIGTISTQSGTTYTFAATDCGTTVRFSNASAVTATIPATLTTNCLIAIEQAGAGKVSVNGSAVTPATLHSAHSYTGTAAQWSIVDVLMESSGVAVLTGDGS